MTRWTRGRICPRMGVASVSGRGSGKVLALVVAHVAIAPHGLLVGGVSLHDLAVTLKAAQGDAPAVMLAYGRVIQSTINFIIVAFASFVGVKAINRLRAARSEP
ncbi:hypothetical protein B1218_35995 [Pseudomonas ogarae]|nr:hypothetical protein B1218_35995 [Pseudomonas ogarae]